MCSSFYHMPSMENYQGDLADIVRAGAGQTLQDSNMNPVSTWEFPVVASDLISHNISDDVDYFGDPFSALRDPLLLHELAAGGGGSGDRGFFSSGGAPNSSPPPPPSGVVAVHHEEMSGGGYFGQPKTNTFDSNNNSCIATRRPSCNFFSRMLQISPNNIMANKLLMPISPRDILTNASSSSSTSSSTCASSSSLVSGDVINASGAPNSSGVQQILSPRNPAIKRRKSQAKKVVCIPAPAPANSRPSGEVVPSDLWAWRKYGQKPIKGSPYPRGYYRCSSSKGCSARKQVERSRTDPNMLVITYTSEHNHPWPTQRNALAGSTRSQPSSKTTAASKTNPSSSTTASQPLADQSTNLKEEPKEMSTSDDMNNNAKEETRGEEADTTKEKKLEEIIMEDDDSDQFNDELISSYKPAMPGSNHSSEDFFAELGEIEADSIDLLLNPLGFNGNEESEERDSKQGCLDPFSFLDWPSGHNNINAASSSVMMAPGQEAAKRGL